MGAARTENAIASRASRQAVRIEDELPSITAPTLVLHATGDRAADFEDATRIASLIPNSRLVPLDSQNHVLLADEPAWRTFLAEVREFLVPSAGQAPRTGRRHQPSAPNLEPATEGIVERIHMLAKAFDRSLEETLSSPAWTVARSVSSASSGSWDSHIVDRRVSSRHGCACPAAP